MKSIGFYLGLDLGQAQDYSALTIVERFEQEIRVDEYEDQRGLELAIATRTRYRPQRGRVKRVEARYDVRYIHRFPLGTPYPAVVEHVRQLMHRRELRGPEGGPTLVLDNTGVGRAVTDLFKVAELRPIAVTITGGNTVNFEGGSYHSPKRDLVSQLSVLLQSGRLRIARELPHAETLRAELVNFRARIDPVSAHDSYGAWREGTHDDLVLAPAVAVWYAERHQSIYGAFEPIRSEVRERDRGILCGVQEPGRAWARVQEVIHALGDPE